jgi:hypothetical protein
MLQKGRWRDMKKMREALTIAIGIMVLALTGMAQDTELGKAKIGTQEASVVKAEQTLHVHAMITASREGGTYRAEIRVRYAGDAAQATLFQADAILAPNASESYTTSTVISDKAPSGTATLEIKLYLIGGFGSEQLAARAETTIEVGG